MFLGNAWKHSVGVRVTREGNSFSCSSDSKDRVVNHFVHPPFNTALCAVTVSLSPTPRTRPRSRQPRVLANITPANHITITTSSKSSSSIIGHPRPGATCNLLERRSSHFHCWDVQCARARMWLSGWLVTWCAALYSTLYTVHCTVHLTPCHTA